ncbi:MAG TPA: hypothetical protein VFJ16_28460 [Longimicrobium sp.]|nr:hypothetical protein [Longimicrobium sp.]
MYLIIDDDTAGAVPATAAAVRAAFHPPELYYGTIVDLRADDGELSAAAATGPFALPADEAECYLSCEVGGRRLNRRGPVSRAETVALFERFLAGERGFAREPEWVESRDGA